MTIDNLIELEDILFVFEKWTLMVKSEFCEELKPGSKVELFDDSRGKLGDAKLGKFLSSRNPLISAIEVSAQTEIADMKKIRYVKAA